MASVTKLGRRDFLKLGAAAGGSLLLGVYLPERGAALTPAAGFQPNAFLRLDADGSLTIWLGRSDMGQGVRTALPMIVADEMDADWDRVRVIQADAHPTDYGRMMTVGSSSVRGGGWMVLRHAGAAAREMLVRAAAERWGVSSDGCTTDTGVVIHARTRRRLSYGELADAASKLPVPGEPRLKDPKRFRLIGTSPPQLDLADRVTGRARYGLDVRRPGMLFATVVHPPVFGTGVKSFNATRALAVRGVKDAFEVSQGVAVVATGTWAAFQGAKALEIEWTGRSALDSDAIFAEFERLAATDGQVARDDGDVDAAFGRATHRLQATYRAPYLAHATMEPMNCTADVRPGRCEIWAPTQNPQGTQSAAARITGLPLEDVTVHVTYLGCGWGRRSSTDFVQDAVETSMKAGGPVQLVWTREEDMQHDFYRPAALVKLEGALDGAGKATALRVRVVAQPISGGRGGRVDGPAVAAIADAPYAVPAFHVDYCRPDLPVPVGYWRSVGPSQNAFILESFLDEMAHAAGRDPVELRLELLAGDPRLKRVVQLAARRSGWGRPLPAGRARGIACVNDTGSYVAQVAEVSLEAGAVRVHKVTCVADCGQVIHPGIVEAQLSGAIIGGLAAALYGEITIRDGHVEQGNFDDYPLLRMSEAPAIDVHIVPSTEAPGGVGEPALPPIAPAVGNALFALTGKRLRSLPIRVETLASEG